MNLLKEIILNQLIKVPAIKTQAKKYHRTGLSHNHDRIAQTYAQLTENSSVKNKDILELGPGKTIEIIQKAKEDGASSISIADIENYLDSEQVSENNINYIIYEGLDIPLPDESFDLIWSNDVLEHTRYPEKIVEETYRLLRPGGMVVHIIDLVDHFSYGQDNLSLTFNCLKYPEWLWKLMTWNRSNYVNRLRASEWVELHKSVGFEIKSKCTTTNEYIKENYKNDDRLKYLLRYTEHDAVSSRITIAAQK